MNTPPPKPAAPPSLIVQFFLRHGSIVSWPVPEGQAFSLAMLVMNVRSNGYFVHEDLYIPGDEIACIGLAGGTARVRNPSIPPQPQHPTKQ